VIENLATDLRRDGQLLARGMCHLLSEGLVTRSGTISRLEWAGAESDLTDTAVDACLADGRTLPLRITRHSHPEGRSMLRFTVAQDRFPPAA
jgi:hypothetical protein